MSTTESISWEDWLATRPPKVRALAQEFPVGLVLEDEDGCQLHVIGYTEQDHLIVSPVSPDLDYHAALASRCYLCAAHVRAGLVRH
jgi:hypothetical protein